MSDTAIVILLVLTSPFWFVLIVIAMAFILRIACMAALIVIMPFAIISDLVTRWRRRK